MIEGIDNITEVVLGLGTAASLVIGFAKRFGGARFVWARRAFRAILRLLNAIDERLD